MTTQQSETNKEKSKKHSFNHQDTNTSIKNNDSLNSSRQNNNKSRLNQSLRNKSNTTCSQLQNKSYLHQRNHLSIDKSYSPKKDVTSVYAVNFGKELKSAQQHYLLGGDSQDPSLDRAVVTTCNIYKSLPQQQHIKSCQCEIIAAGGVKNCMTPQVYKIKKSSQTISNSQKEDEEDEETKQFRSNQLESYDQDDKQYQLTQEEEPEEEIVTGFIPAAGNPRPLLMLSGNSLQQNNRNLSINRQKHLTLSNDLPHSISSASSSFSLFNGTGGGNDNVEQKTQPICRQSVITQHCDSEESPGKKQQSVRKKRAMTIIQHPKSQTAINKRSVSNPRGGLSNSAGNKIKKATTTSSINFGGRKNSVKNVSDEQLPTTSNTSNQLLSSNNMNIISTPRQCSQLLPASAIITSNSHVNQTNSYQQKALNIINSQILNQSSSNKGSGGGVKCMTPVLLSRQKQLSSHSTKNSVGSMPGSTSNKKSINTPTSANKRRTNKTIALLSNNIQPQTSNSQASNSSYQHLNIGSSTPSTPLKSTIVSQRPSSAARSHSSLMNSITNTPNGANSHSNKNNIVSKNSSSMIQTDSQQLNKQQQDVENNIFMKRIFVNTEQTSDAIHLSWLHPRNFSKKQKQFMQLQEDSKQQDNQDGAKIQGAMQDYITSQSHNNNSILEYIDDQMRDEAAFYSKSLFYILEYGVGMKVNNKEQFRQIYKGPQHKCIITDLNPKTVYRFRVAPYMSMDNSPEKELKGQWSDVIEVMTRDTIAVETRSMAKHARLINSGKTILFERPGLVHASYGYFFGKYCWSISIQLTSNGVLNHQDCTGLMKVGVAVRQGRAYKLVGVNVNYSLEKSEFVVKLILDCDARNLKIQTASEKGWEVLPLSRHFPYIPAIQNKTPLRAPNYQLKSRIQFDQSFQQ